jgi:hypothetical protein
LLARASQGPEVLPYLHECAVANDMVREDPVPEGRDGEGAQQAVHAELPGLLALAGAGVDAGHEEDDVERRQRVEDLHVSVPGSTGSGSRRWPYLEGKVPDVGSIATPARGEDVQVAGAKDERIEGLREKGDACAMLDSVHVVAGQAPTLGAAVGVHGPYQDQLRRRVRHIAEDVEEVEPHRSAASWEHSVAASPMSRGAAVAPAVSTSITRQQANKPTGWLQWWRACRSNARDAPAWR